MNNKSEWSPRLSIVLTEEQAKDLQRLIPWGMKKMVFHALIDMLILSLKTFGPKVLTTILARELNLPNVLAGKEGD